jgi:hypothetical protein
MDPFKFSVALSRTRRQQKVVASKTAAEGERGRTRSPVRCFVLRTSVMTQNSRVLDIENHRLQQRAKLLSNNSFSVDALLLLEHPLGQVLHDQRVHYPRRGSRVT